MDFLKAFRDDHHEFVNGTFDDIDASNPIAMFELWFKDAVNKKELESNAFVLSTVSCKGVPSSRILYLKELNDGKFVFFTNYESQKGSEIAENDNVSMLFFWPQQSRQIRISGSCKKTSKLISDTYFNSRPKSSQIGAWASMQSKPLESRESLEKRVEELDEKYSNVVPRPSFWGGYEVDPFEIEFWQGRPSRLHDRVVFEKKSGDWIASRKNP